MEIKMLVNKKTDMIIGRLLNENPYFPGGPMYRILIKGDQKFIKSDHVEVRKFKSRTK